MEVLPWSRAREKALASFDQFPGGRGGERGQGVMAHFFCKGGVED